MKSKLIWANFTVKDARRTNEFYTQLGFTPYRSPQGDPKLASFFFGDGKFVIHFFEQGSKIDKFFRLARTLTKLCLHFLRRQRKKLKNLNLK